MGGGAPQCPSSGTFTSPPQGSPPYFPKEAVGCFLLSFTTDVTASCLVLLCFYFCCCSLSFLSLSPLKSPGGPDLFISIWILPWLHIRLGSVSSSVSQLSLTVVYQLWVFFLVPSTASSCFALLSILNPQKRFEEFQMLLLAFMLSVSQGEQSLLGKHQL